MIVRKWNDCLDQIMRPGDRVHTACLAMYRSKIYTKSFLRLYENSSRLDRTICSFGILQDRWSRTVNKYLHTARELLLYNAELFSVDPGFI